jgi:hypothetical protein
LLTLLNGISLQLYEAAVRFTNVNDVTHDHANPRAICTNAVSAFRGTSVHLATTKPMRTIHRVFHRGDVRERRPELLANQALNSDPAATISQAPMIVSEFSSSSIVRSAAGPVSSVR